MSTLTIKSPTYCVGRELKNARAYFQVAEHWHDGSEWFYWGNFSGFGRCGYARISEHALRGLFSDLESKEAA